MLMYMAMANAVQRAQRRLANFQPRGSLCPLCHKEFRTCPHDVGQARAIMEQRVVEQIVRRELKRNGQKDK